MIEAGKENNTEAVIELCDEKVEGAVEPPKGHKGYAAVSRGRVVGYFKYYDTAKVRAVGGLVVKAEDVEKHG